MLKAKISQHITEVRAIKEADLPCIVTTVAGELGILVRINSSRTVLFSPELTEVASFNSLADINDHLTIAEPGKSIEIIQE